MSTLEDEARAIAHEAFSKPPHMADLTAAIMELVRRGQREIGQQLPHSTKHGNSLEIWSWKTPTGRKWNAAYIDSKRRPADICTGDNIAEALEKLAALTDSEAKGGEGE